MKYFGNILRIFKRYFKRKNTLRIVFLQRTNRKVAAAGQQQPLARELNIIYYINILEIFPRYLKIKNILRIVFTQGGGRGPTTTPGSRIRTTTTLPPSEEKQNLPLILIFGFEKTNICFPLFSSVFKRENEKSTRGFDF